MFCQSIHLPCRLQSLHACSSVGPVSSALFEPDFSRVGFLSKVDFHSLLGGILVKLQISGKSIAPRSFVRSFVQCCFTSTEFVRIIRDGEPRTAASTFTRLPDSDRPAKTEEETVAATAGRTV